MKTYTDHQKEQVIGQINELLAMLSVECLCECEKAMRDAMRKTGRLNEVNDAPHLRLVTGQSRGGKRHADRSASAAG